MPKNLIRSSVLVLVIYLLLTILLNFPLWRRLSFATYGYTGDSYGFLWQLWWGKETDRQLINGKLTPLLGAPFGSPIDYYFCEPLLLGFGRLLARVTNHFVAFNLVLLVSFPLAGLTTYWLAKYLTKNSLAAFLAGLIFAFSPYHFWQAYTHVNLSQIQWLPLFLLAWLVFLRRPQVKNFLFLFLSYLLVFSPALFMAILPQSYLG